LNVLALAKMLFFEVALSLGGLGSGKLGFCVIKVFVLDLRS